MSNPIDGPCPRVVPAWNPNLGPTICSGVGICDADKKCNCTEGYEGNACEYKVCPSGRAWWDEASGPNDAHKEVPCSHRGFCNRASGYCECDREFGLVGGPSSSTEACNVLNCDENKTMCGQTGRRLGVERRFNLALRHRRASSPSDEVVVVAARRRERAVAAMASS